MSLFFLLHGGATGQKDFSYGQAGHWVFAEPCARYGDDGDGRDDKDNRS